jgi:ubiquinone/menaquinone biosynthesis C-methylase UbiE
MVIGKFDTDSEALKRRIESHDQFGSADLNAWIFEHLAPAAGQRVLDLGCGTGKQTVPIAGIVGETGSVVSVDLSESSLTELSEKAKVAGVAGRIQTVCAGLDQIELAIGAKRFDRIISSFSLYYAKSPEELLKKLHTALNPDGIFFFCGPSAQNNAELKKLHYGLMDEPSPASTASAMFMEGDGPRIASDLFASVEKFTFENPLSFNSAHALYTYWSSYNLYDESIDSAFREAAARHFEIEVVFKTVKRAVGVKAVR